MSFLMIIFGAAAVAVGSVQTISHLAGGKATYLFGNAHFFGVLLEGVVLWTTIMSAGTISGLLINTLAGLMIYGILELGAKIKGGKRICWKWELRSNGRLGFYTVDIKPTMNLKTFISGVKSFFMNTFDTIRSSFKEV